MSMHKVFLSYHHRNDQFYKKELLKINEMYNIFIDSSVDTGGIGENLSDQEIRQIIRDDYLRDTTVTIVLVGTETKKRKHVDWEIYSSMYNGLINKQSGILVINLPTTNCNSPIAAHGNTEKQIIYPHITNWSSLKSIAEYNSHYPFLPDRIIDNLFNDFASISVTNWDTVKNNPETLRLLVDLTFQNRSNCNYNLRRPMRRANS